MAAFAAHMADADMALAASAGSHCSMVVPRSASQPRFGRGSAGNSLRQAQREIRPHLVDALQGGGPRLRHLPRMLHRRDIAEAQARIIVRRADDSVEVDFAKGHQREAAITWSPTLISSSSAASASMHSPFFLARFVEAKQARNSSGGRRRGASWSRPPSRSRSIRLRATSPDRPDRVHMRGHGRTAVENVDVAVVGKTFLLKHPRGPLFRLGEDVR